MAVDEPNALLSILSSGWTAANTDNKTPTFKRVLDVKRIPETVVRGYDYVLAYETAANVKPIALGGQDEEKVVVTLDIRSDGNGQADPRAHALKVRDEVVRIVRATYGDAIGSKYDSPQIVSRRDLSDKMKELHRFLVEVELVDWVV